MIKSCDYAVSTREVAVEGRQDSPAINTWRQSLGHEVEFSHTPPIRSDHRLSIVVGTSGQSDAKRLSCRIQNDK